MRNSLADLRAEHGLSQAALAQALDVSRQTIISIERGRFDPSLPLAFKIAAVPFHMWTPDVYEGAPTPVTAFFASAPKVAAMGLAVRVAVEAMGPATGEWRQIVIFAALASIILGAVAAIGQTNIKRLLAYSSINNVGFALVGLAAGTPEGVALSGRFPYLADGDVVEVAIDGIGTQRHRMVAEASA